MAGRYKGKHPRRRHYIKQWRLYREMTQDELGAEIGMSAANLSRLESFGQDYSQGILEALAKALRCDPADLLVRDPNDEDQRFSYQELAAIAKAARQAAE